MFISFHFFFFKHKTAYDLRISDWSSDVCSSDLIATKAAARKPERAAVDRDEIFVHHVIVQREEGLAVIDLGGSRGIEIGRSEEHTSELQSLMRLSYAVFCLKKNNRDSRRPQ